jgi:hypothetical protein
MQINLLPECAIINIPHEGKSVALDRKLSTHNNINKINIAIFTVDIYNLFLYSHPIAINYSNIICHSLISIPVEGE